MKRGWLILALLCYAVGAWASPVNDGDSVPTHFWETKSHPSLKVDEQYFNNWAKEGNSQVAFITTFSGNYKYTHPKYIWDNVVELGFGIYFQDLDGNQSLESIRKNEDKIDVTSTFSMRLRHSWNVNASANFKSQFYDGNKYANAGNDEDPQLISSFMAPAYLTTAIGFEYKKDFWNVSASFLTGKVTFVTNQDVIDAGQLYGVDTAGGKRYYAALGSYLKFYYKKEVLPKLVLYARLELFYDYNKPNAKDWSAISDGSYDNGILRHLYCLRYDTDVDFEFSVEYRFLRWLAASLSCKVKYDTDFATDGVPNSGRFGLCQFYQTAGLQFYFIYRTPKKPRS